MADNQDEILFPQSQPKTPAPTEEGMFSNEGKKYPNPQYAPETIAGKVKATAAGIPEGAAYRMGLFGDIQSGAQSLQAPFVDWATGKLQKYGVISPETATEASTKAKAALEAYNKKVQEAGLPKTDFPTSEQLINLTPEALKYQPQNPAEERYKSGSSMATQLVGGGGGKGVYEKLVKPVVEGFGAGYVAKGAEQAVEGHPAERWIAPVAAILGQAGTGKLLNAVKNLPTDVQTQTMIAQSLAKDIRNGKIKLTKEQIDELSASGAPLSIADIVTPDSATAKMINQQAGVLGETTGKASERNIELADPDLPRLNKSRERTEQIFQRSGGPLVLEPAQLQNQINAARRLENDRVYSLAMNDPASQNIYAGSLGDIVTRPKVIDAIREAYDGPTGIIHERDPSIFKLPGRDPVTGAESPGNLAYWNKVKQILGDKYNSLTDEFGRVIPGKENEYRMLKNTMDDLKDALVQKTTFVDPATGRNRSLYAEALDTASEGFGAADAPSAGRKFYKTGDSMRADQFERLHGSYSDENKDFFKNGFLSQMYDDISRSKNGYSNIAEKIAANKNGFADKARIALGPDFEPIKNHILAESVYNSASQIVPKAGKFSRLTGPAGMGIEAGVSAAGLYAFLNDIAFGAQMFDPNLLLPAAAAGVPTYFGRKALQARAKTVGNKVLNLVSKGDPASMKKLVKLAQEEPMVSPMLERLNTGVRAYQQQQMGTEGAVPTNQSELPREGRATGGKVKSDVMAKAARLLAMADSMHKKNTQETEKILNVDDNTVAKALAVANKGI